MIKNFDSFIPYYSSLKGFGNRMQWQWQLKKQYHGKTTGTSASIQQL